MTISMVFYWALDCWFFVFLLLHDNLILLRDICIGHTFFHAFNRSLKASYSVLHCRHGTLQLAQVSFTAFILFLTDWISITFCYCSFDVLLAFLNALFHIFFDLLPLHFQFINVSSKHRFGHHVTLTAAPKNLECFSWFNVVPYSCLPKWQRKKPYFTAVPLNENFFLLVGLPDNFLRFPHLVSVTAELLFLVKLHNPLWSPSPTSVFKPQ